MVVALALLAAPTSVSAQRPFFQPLVLDGGKVKWQSTALAAGAVVTYAFAARATITPGARNCGEMHPLRQLSGTSATIDLRAIRSALQRALERWERVADLRFVETSDEASANIVIGEQSVPVGRAFANVATRGDVRNGVKEIDRSLVCINGQQRWKIGFDGNLEVYDLAHTFTHEIGHAIGLDHPGGRSHVMSQRYDETVADLSEGDIAGAVALYGPRITLATRAEFDPVQLMTARRAER